MMVNPSVSAGWWQEHVSVAERQILIPRRSHTVVSKSDMHQPICPKFVMIDLC